MNANPKNMLPVKRKNNDQKEKSFGDLIHEHFNEDLAVIVQRIFI